MKIIFHKNFEKKYQNMRANTKKRVKERLGLFLRDEFDPVLNNHPLRGKYQGYRSINTTGDLRAVYGRVSEGRRIFVVLDTHNKLYR